jgi:uncharacterized membrane protein YkoI
MKATHGLMGVMVLFVVGTVVTTAQAQGEQKRPAVPFKSSIQVPDDKNRPKPATDEEKKAEERRLLALARVTPEAAKAAGLAAYDGVFKYVKIHNYDSNLAYEVEFKDGLELIIDAGNKAILQIRIEKGSAMDKARKEAGK